jgi:hypothetical protein
MKNKFEIGDCVKLSEPGRLKFPKTPDRRGTIIRIAPTRTRYRVQWEGQATAEYIYWSYLERVGRNEPARASAGDGSQNHASHVNPEQAQAGDPCS